MKHKMFCMYILVELREEDEVRAGIELDTTPLAPRPGGLCEDCDYKLFLNYQGCFSRYIILQLHKTKTRTVW